MTKKNRDPEPRNAGERASELEATESQCRAAVEAARDAIIFADAAGRIRFWNRGARETFGWTEDEALGQPLSMLMPERHRRAHEEGFARLRRTGESRIAGHVLSVEGLRKDGSELPLELMVTTTAVGGETTVCAVLRDVTERKRAEEALEESRSLYRDLVETSPDLIFRCDVEGRLTFLNSAFERLFGYRVEEMLGRPFGDFQTPEAAEKDRQELERSLASGGATYYETTGISKSGDELSLVVSSTLTRDAAGCVVGLQGIVRDVTERRRMEKARRRSDDLLRGFEKNVPVALYIKDLQGRMLEINELAASALGMSPDEVIGKTLYDLIPREAADAATERDRQVVEDGKPIQTEETVPLPGGDTRVYLTTKFPLRDEDSRVCAVAGASIDITERKRAEEELEESRALYRDLVETSQDLVWKCDAEGRFTFLNRSWERTHGHRVEEMLGRPFTDFQTREVAERDLKALARAMAGRRATGYETTHVSKSGGEIHLVFNAIPLFDTEGRVVGTQGTARDVSEQKVEERKRAMLEEQLALAQRAESVGRLAGGVAHDFNNVVSVILWNCELLLDELEPGDPGWQELSDVRGAAMSAASLTSQLLAYSGKQVLALTVIDLNTTVRHVERMLRPIIGEDVDLRVVLEKPLDPVKADAAQIEQVIMNLAVNARDAMKKGGRLTIETRNVVLDEEFGRTHAGGGRGPHVRLTVNDTGTGMSEEVRARVFEPFFTTKGKGVGTGLGLSTAYGIVKQSGGGIWVQSEPGRGTSFEVCLPSVKEPIEEPHPAVAKVPPAPSAKTILLVEDDVAVRRSVHRILQRQGNEVLLAEDGGAALRVAEKHGGRIDLLLTDVVMPGMGGPELAARLVRAREDTRVLFMSGHTDDAIARHGILDRGVALLRKPFTAEELASKVSEVLDEQPSTGKERARASSAAGGGGGGDRETSGTL